MTPRTPCSLVPILDERVPVLDLWAKDCDVRIGNSAHLPQIFFLMPTVSGQGIWKESHPLSHHQSHPLRASGAVAGVAQFVGVLSCKLKGHEFGSWSGHTPRLWFPLVRARIEATDQRFSPSLSPLLPLSLNYFFSLGLLCRLPWRHDSFAS